jgi:hypothetical protein
VGAVAGAARYATTLGAQGRRGVPTCPTVCANTDIGRAVLTLAPSCCVWPSYRSTVGSATLRGRLGSLSSREARACRLEPARKKYCTAKTRSCGSALCGCGASCATACVGTALGRWRAMCVWANANAADGREPTEPIYYTVYTQAADSTRSPEL